LANKICVLTLLLALGAPLRAELLKLSLLAKPAPKFTLKLDIFQGRNPADLENSRPAAAMGPVQAEDLQKTIAEEIQQSITYEGFIVKNGRKLALLNVSGEFFAVSEGEIVLEKIKILKIGKDKVIIEYDGQPYDIRFKGE
jgi:type II secretory pathway component PulC